LHELGVALQRALPHAAFLFHLKRFVISKKTSPYAASDVSLEEAARGLTLIICQNLASSKQVSSVMGLLIRTG
jgi:hypothetical protein